MFLLNIYNIYYANDVFHIIYNIYTHDDCAMINAYHVFEKKKKMRNILLCTVIIFLKTHYKSLLYNAPYK